MLSTGDYCGKYCASTVEEGGGRGRYVILSSVVEGLVFKFSSACCSRRSINSSSSSVSEASSSLSWSPASDSVNWCSSRTEAGSRDEESSLRLFGDDS